MYKSDEEHTSFIIDHGLYCHRAMPFGLKNAGMTYQRLVNMMFKDMIGNTMEVYVEDMLVKSRMVGDHIEHLRQMFNVLLKYQMKLDLLKCAFGVRSGKFLGFMVNQRGIKANHEKIKALLKMNSPKKPKEVMTLASRVAALSRFVSQVTDHYALFFNVLKGSKRFEWIDKCEQAFQALKKHLERPSFLSKSIEGEKLYLYLAVSKEAVNATLIREEEKIQWLVYYISKRLMDAKTRYPELEKLALALVVTSRNLRPYFHTHSIKVLTNYLLHQVLQKPQAGSSSGRSSWGSST